MAFHSTHRKGNQSKLLFFHSKGSQFSSWGLLHCDDRRSPWWASRDRPQHDRSRSDTVMISMNFNSYARLYFSSFLFFLFCFWKQNFIYYTSVSCVWFLLPYVNLQSNWAWKPLKLGLSIWFYLWGFLSQRGVTLSISFTIRCACQYKAYLHIRNMMIHAKTLFKFQ